MIKKNKEYTYVYFKIKKSGRIKISLDLAQKISIAIKQEKKWYIEYEEDIPILSIDLNSIYCIYGGHNSKYDN